MKKLLVCMFSLAMAIALTGISKIDGVTWEALLDAFGEGNVTVTFSLE